MTRGTPSPSADVESLGRTLGKLRDPADGRAGDEILRALLDEGVAASGALAGGVFMLDDGGANLELTIAVRYPEPLADRYRLVPLAADVPLVDTVKTSTPIFLESLADYVARYPAFAKMHPELAQNAFVSLPLVCAGGCVGGIVLGFDAARRFTPEARASLLALGVRCCGELERLRVVGLEQSSQKPPSLASQRLERLHAFTGTLAQTITPAQVIEAVIDMGLAATSARSSALWLWSPDGTDLVLGGKRGSGGPGSEELARVPLDGPARLPIVDVARDGVVVWIESRGQLGERYPGLEPSSGAEESFAGLPLVAEGRRIGALTYGFEGPHRFLEDERAFLQVISWYSAQALQRANLYGAERVAKERAEDADRLKDEFIAMLSHELRNPLAPIVSAVELMERQGGDHFARERAMIARNVRHLAKLLDDLLDVARTTRDKVQLVKDRCALGAIVAAAVEMASPLVEQRRHHLTVSAPARAIEVMADDARLTQAIANLVTNAAKYTPPGGAIAITVTEEGNEAVVGVRDSGQGIAAELLPRIFDPFVQGATSLDRAQGGLGIGLTVAKNLVTLHGGTLSAESAGVGQGSAFVVRMPRAGPAVVVAGVAAARDAPIPTGHSHRVLAVDDNHDAGQMLGRALEALGCSVLVVHDGVSAITSAASFDPQLVLLDIGLPGLDGYEVAHRLRASRGGRPLRIVAVTGYGQPSDRLRSQEAGFDGHIIKPVTIEALQRLLAALAAPAEA